MNWTVCAAALAIFAKSFAFAESPNLLTYQGRLVESGTPVSGVRKIEIKLCDGPSGPCFPTGPQNIPVSNGLFRSTFTVPPSVNLSTGDWHIEIEVEDSPLSPREKLTSSPYSLHSSSASYAHNLSAASGAAGVFASTSLFVTDGKLGIGTTMPVSKFQVAGGDIGLGDENPMNNQPITVWLVNASGAGRSAGEIVVVDPAFDDGFTVTNIPSTTTVVGVVYEDIPMGNVGRIAIGGVVPVRSDVATTPGAHVVTSANPGWAGSTFAPGTGASIGVWLQAVSAGGTGRALLR